MSAKKFTDLYLSKLKPDPARYVWDSLLPAFGMYVGKSKKTFVIVRTGGRREKIGPYPDIPLTEARAIARLRLTGLPSKVPVTFSEATERYLSLRQPDLTHNTYIAYKSYLKAFRGQLDDLQDITQAQILAHLDTLENPSTKAHAARALKTFFNWCLEREYCRRNPLSAIKMPKEPSSRERVLSDEELRMIWQRLYDFNQTKTQLRFAGLCRLLICTGQRLNQIASLKEEWIDHKRKVIHFPSEIMKNRRPHDYYYYNATGIYLAQYENRSVFTNAKKYLPALREQLPIPHFTLHDFRRTYATISSRVGNPPHLTERLLSHAQPEGNIASIYNRYRYEKELREAARKIETHIIELIIP